MKILITGGAGFIGYNFCKYLLKNTNYKIISIDNINDYYSPILKKARLKDLKKYENFKFYKFDLCDKKKLDKIFRLKFNIVYHFAAQAGVRYSLINPRSYVNSNILAFYNLIEVVKKNKVKNFFMHLQAPFMVIVKVSIKRSKLFSEKYICVHKKK